MKQIKLPIHNILVEFDTENPEVGSILSPVELFEVCPKCNQRECVYSCDESQGVGPGDSTETEASVSSRLQTNGAVDAILSIILAHACAGIDIESPAYLEGIETAFDAVGNNI